MNTRYRRACNLRAQVSHADRQHWVQRAAGFAVVALAYAIVVAAACILP
jgi:hypothetical protein